MTAADPRTFPDLTKRSRDGGSTSRAEQSLGHLFRPAPGVTAVDPLAYGARFPDRWMAFLHAHHSSPTEVAFVYGVTEKAAQKWWNGVGGPQGAKVGIAFLTNPVGAQEYLIAAE